MYTVAVLSPPPTVFHVLAVDHVPPDSPNEVFTNELPVVKSHWYRITFVPSHTPTSKILCPLAMTVLDMGCALLLPLAQKKYGNN